MSHQQIRRFDAIDLHEAFNNLTNKLTTSKLTRDYNLPTT